MTKSKQQKPITLALLVYTASSELLQRLAKKKSISADFMEQKLIACGGQAVYPSKPFKYGYKIIYTNKAQLQKKPIGITRALNRCELNLIFAFAGLESIKLCKTDEDCLRFLKSLLTQKCNVQNPDDLTWKEILSHVRIYSNNLGQITSGISTPSPSIEKAYQSSNYAISNNPKLDDATDKQVHDWLSLHGFTDYSLPAFDTWQRYVRAGRRHYGTSKNKPRAGRKPITSIDASDPAVKQLTSKLKSKNG